MNGFERKRIAQALRKQAQNTLAEGRDQLRQAAGLPPLVPLLDARKQMTEGFGGQALQEQTVDGEGEGRWPI